VKIAPIEFIFGEAAMRFNLDFLRLVREIRKLGRDERGHVAVIFTLLLVPLIGLTGGAIDYTRASAAKVAMQAALDATALALSKEAANLTQAQLTQKAHDYFLAAFNRPDAYDVKVNATYSNAAGSTVVISSSSVVKSHFLGILGIDQMNISSSTMTKWGTKRLRVALALDVTGSMASNNKLSTMKTAAKNLIDELKSVATNPGDVYISIIPFNKDVNAGPSNHASSWIRWDLWDAQNGSCAGHSHGNPSSKSSCQNRGGTWTPADHSTWNGCVMDRDQNYDTTNTEPTNNATRFPAEQFSSCPEPLMGLSNDWNALTQKIDDLTATGNTNQTIGLQWAYQSLTASSPLTVPAKDALYKYEDAIILLTDGMNTENRFTSSQSSIDNRMQAACNNVKAANITVYTVLVMAGNASLLQNCASSSSKYFYLTSPDQLIATFNTIATELSQLRLAK
jgi:Flp pilus assembly protein TadG